MQLTCVDSKTSVVFNTVTNEVITDGDFTALQLADGKTVQAIAINRGVAVGTVRAQIKAIFTKIGVNRQIELVARVSQL